MLFGYFDESGVHEGASRSVIAGMLGTAAAWEGLSQEWQEIMGGRAFHYTHLNRKFGNGAFKSVAKAERDSIIERCAEAIAKQDLLPVAGGLLGDWASAIEVGSDWSMRFPSCYSFCLEMCVEQLNRLANSRWAGEPVALIFSAQDQYASRAQEVWRTFKGNGQWLNMATLQYAPMKTLAALQAADMFAYETYRLLGSPDVAEYQKWPLWRRILAKDASDFVGGYQTEKSFVEMMRRSEEKGRTYLKKVD